jgi:hypothetical protein
MKKEGIIIGLVLLAGAIWYFTKQKSSVSSIVKGMDAYTQKFGQVVLGYNIAGQPYYGTQAQKDAQAMYGTIYS